MCIIIIFYFPLKINGNVGHRLCCGWKLLETGLVTGADSVTQTATFAVKLTLALTNDADIKLARISR